MKNLKLLPVLMPILLMACQKQAELNYIEWQPGQSLKKQEAILHVSAESSAPSARYRGRQIEIVRQTIDGKPVLNSFVKKVSTSQQVDLLQAQIVDHQNKLLNLSRFGLQKVNLAEQLKKQDSRFSRIDVISQEDIYMIENQKLVDCTSLTFTDQTGTAYVTYFDQNNKLLRTVRAGSRFSDITTNLYADGPKLSPLTDVILKGLSSDPALSNSFVFVTSESDKKIGALSSVLKFLPEDDRFDQIQVFYYLNKSFQWMRDNLQVQLPDRIDAVVHLGFPEKTNSAFYLQGKIRFGQGDGLTYANIPHDASIVIHESFHALIDSFARLPFDGEGGSLNEGFADFLTCLQLNRPYLGESSFLKGPYKRSVMNTSKLDEKNGGLYHDSLIISGTLWEIKEKLGADKAKTLALETLLHLNSASRFSDFSEQMALAAKSNLSHEDQDSVMQIMKARAF